jgi:hypothetical protein
VFFPFANLLFPFQNDDSICHFRKNHTQKPPYPNELRRLFILDFLQLLFGRATYIRANAKRDVKGGGNATALRQ